MNKLEKLDNLLMYWKAKEEVAEKSGKPGLKSEFSKVILGLTLARGILKEPSNTRMHVDTKPDCPACKIGRYFVGVNCCINCGKALGQ